MRQVPGMARERRPPTASAMTTEIPFPWEDQNRLDVKTMMRHAQVREAIASVAMSHPASCECVICRAQRGDEEAFAYVLSVYES